MHFAARRATYARIGRASIPLHGRYGLHCSFPAPRAFRPSLLSRSFALPLGGCSFDLGSWGSDKDKPQAAAQKPTDTISAARRQRRTGLRHARPGSRQIRQDRRSAGGIRSRARARSLQRAGPVWPRPDLSGREAAPAGDRGFHRGQRPDAATGRAAAGARDQLPRASTRPRKPLPISTRRCRPIRTARQAWSARGQAYERLGDKAKASASYGRALALRPQDEAARSGLARTGG